MQFEEDASMILLSAASLLERRGWTQGVSFDVRSKSFDLVGAMACSAGVTQRALGKSDLFALDLVASARRSAVLFAWEALEIKLDTDPESWNDTKGRTASEVISLLCTVSTEIAIRSEFMKSFH